MMRNERDRGACISEVSPAAGTDMQPSEQHPAMSRPCSRVKGKRGRAFGAPTGVVPRIASVRPRTAGVFYFLSFLRGVCGRE